METKSLSCQCKANSEDIDVVDMDRFAGFSDYVPDLEGYKYTSYKTMKCYKLVFSFKHFIKNAGSIIVSLILIAYAVFIVFYIMRGISPLKIYISNYLFNDKEEKKEYPNINTLNPFITIAEKSQKSTKSKKKKLESKSVKTSKKGHKNILKGSKNELLYPPKKSRANKSRISSGEKRKDTENVKLIDIINKKKKFGRMQKYHNIKNKKEIPLKDNKKKVEFDIESMKSDKVRRRKSIIDLEKAREIKLQEQKEKEREKILNLLSDYKLRKAGFDDDNDNDKDKEKKPEIKKPPKEKEKVEEDKNIYDDYELNHMEYKEALKEDKRSFWQIYWSILKRDQLILFGFASWNDYNLYYVKIVRFLFTILTLMAMNGFLYADKSIHYLYINGVKYNFGKQILQIVLSIIITHVMEILLCFLSLTDRHIYEIKGLPKTEATANRIFEILRKMKIKLILFYIMVVLISLFYWYFISAFCAVYHNTQGLYIVDCVISFIFFSIDPFIIYALVTLLRVLSFKKISNKKIKWLYTISRLFPVF